MMQLKHLDGTMTINPSEIRIMTRDIYSGLFSAEGCDPESVVKITAGLPQSTSLDSKISFDEMTATIHQLSCGCSLRSDSLNSFTESSGLCWK